MRSLTLAQETPSPLQTQLLRAAVGTCYCYL